MAVRLAGGLLVPVARRGVCRRRAPAAGGAGPPPPAEAEAAAGAGGMPADVVDAKLWDGAAAGGWSVLARGDTHWTYVSPAGERVSSRQQALGIAAAARGPLAAGFDLDGDYEDDEDEEAATSTASAARTRRTWRRSRWRRWRRRCSPTPTRWR